MFMEGVIGINKWGRSEEDNGSHLGTDRQPTKRNAASEKNEHNVIHNIHKENFISVANRP